MSKPVKIFDLSMDKWMGGLSRQSSIMVDGLFSSSSNFDPFEISGMMQCSLASTKASDLDITVTPTTINSFQKSGVGYLYVHSPTKLYEVLDGSPYTTVDKTANISAASSVRGSIIFNGYYVYSLSNTVRARIVPVTSGSDVQILSLATDGTWHPFCVGADGNLYIGDYGVVGKITKSLAAGEGVLGTTGNVGTAVALESGMYVRDLVNDGRYLVIIADNNPSGDYNNTGGSTPPVPVNGNYRCQVLFWDMIKSTFDQRFEFNDSYLIGAKILDGGIYVFGGDNLYVCNISTPPKAIFNFRSPSTITEKPQTPYQIIRSKNSIYWCGQSNAVIYAYGSLFPGMKKIFYQPFNSTHTPSTLGFNGSKFYIGTSGTDNFLQVSDTGTTRNTGSVITAPILLPQPYKIAYVKVIMRNLFASGDSINVYMSSQNANEEVLSSNSQTFTQVGSRQVIIFDKHLPGGAHTSEADVFEDFQLTVISNKAVAKVEVWATPVDSQTQTI